MRALVAILLLGAMTPATDARTVAPRFKSRLIEPGRSIGGVRIGMEARKAIRRWGTIPCNLVAEVPVCYWGYGKVYALMGFVKGKAVDSLNIGVMQSADARYRFKGPIVKLATRKGIHLGSRLSKLKAAYPHLIWDDADSAGGKSFHLGNGRRRTTFAVEKGRVVDITIFVHRGP